MKVGTDAVMLGAWASCDKPADILDIGTGCGILSLMMAQRFYKAKITAIDIHKESIKQAGENFEASTWINNLSAKNISLQYLAKEGKTIFDLILSNPPYFIDSLLPPDESKKIAKHTESLSYAELAEGASGLLRPAGRFALILPFEKKQLFVQLAKENKLFLSRELVITPIEGKIPNRVLLEFTLEENETEIDQLTIRKKSGEYTEDYKKFTRDFYLAL